MIVDNLYVLIPFEKLGPGDVWKCPKTREWFMKITVVDALNCVRLSDGKLFNRCEEWDVNFYRSARMVMS